MLERLVRFVARTACAISQGTKIDGVLERPCLCILNSRSARIVDHRVADIAVVSNDLACLTDVLAVMAAETALGIEVAGIVRMRLPVSLHLREEVILKYPLKFRNRLLDNVLSLSKDLFVICSIKFRNVRIDRIQRLGRGFVLSGQSGDGLSLEERK